MKKIRVELKLTAIVHVGDDITEDCSPDRDPDAVTSCVLTRVAHLWHVVPAGDAVSYALGALMVNSAPVLGERLRHELREKGF